MLERASHTYHYCAEQNYSSIDPLLNRSRLIMLQSVQALTEIQDFLHYMTGEGELPDP